MIGEIVLPARLASTRLPEKLLLNETGKTVLEHTYQACQTAMRPKGITIAVDHPRLFDTVTGFGGRAQLTDVNAQSGTDRVAEVARGRPDVDLFINVQGDEPEIAGSSIDAVMGLLESDSTAQVATLATPIRNRYDLEDPACVKVVRALDGAALYFSRSVIPHPRSWDDALLIKEPPVFLQHLGIYAYRRDFLLRLQELQPSELEQIEKLEQLRFLQSGCRIVVGIVSRSPRGIDTREDYDQFKIRWQSRGN
ncbi:MAG: 3-deoxy-manno-octulosonate cytidylyltransferase [Planctomycetota bacterium]|nr:3-deoxy-manno-octulosonate cytidylyltransferase [Planctomycetota bacterium]